MTPLGFFRCHRSYIVNLKKVREIIIVKYSKVREK
ncbi:LytTR family transcriptional regulator DNA-binding domain-containing protein [Solibacillus sp. FSL H8-0538]